MRERTGSIVRDEQGRPEGVRLTLADGTRSKVIPLPEDERTDEAARACAKRWSDLVVEHKFVAGDQVIDVVTGETVERWASRWVASRKERGLTSVSSDEHRLDNHILPALGPKPMAVVSRADLELLVEKLDRRVLDGELSWKTAWNIWAVATKMFADAAGSKIRALRVREDNPAANVPGPDRGSAKAKTFLFPSEFLTLISCEDVPLRWRRLFTIAIYT
ncbi:MAG: hypothetical protein ACREI8_05225, partial [Myxococcota bacterium]